MVRTYAGGAAGTGHGSEYKPMFPSKEAYLEYVDHLNDKGDRIVYYEDSTIEARVE